jgi:hypothetical protein
MQFRTKAISHAIAVAIATGALLGAGAAQAGGIITFGETTLGVNDSGELNFYSEAGPGGAMIYGVYRNGIGDAISPGCACEGWGVSITGADGFSTSAFANQSSGSSGYSGGTFGISDNRASSNVTMNGAPVSISHFYGPSLQADTFQAQVQISNNGLTDLENLVYRRAMDWDVPPSPFSEYVTHGGVVANLVANGGNVLYASNNGFANSDPLSDASWIDVGVDTINTDFVKAGPADHGSVFDFAFGTLKSGETRIFNIFYGTAASEGDALSKISALGANVYSLGQPAGYSEGGEGDGGEGEGGGDVPTAPGDAEISSVGVPSAPETFFFAFGGVGGIELGSTQENPILPFQPAPETFVFTAPQPRRWFDPPFVEGFDIALEGGGEFLEVMAPDGFFDLKIIVGDVVVDGDFDGGESYFFAPGVAAFRIAGIAPLLDASSPGFGSAFPLFLDFTNPEGTTMTWTAMTLAPVPEPAEWALMLLAAPLLGWQIRRRRSRA